MKKRSWKGRGLAVLFAAVLQACGGGDAPDNNAVKADDGKVVQQPASVTVTSYDGVTGAALAGATVTLNDTEVGKTDAKGQLQVTTQAGPGVVLRVSLAHYGDALTRLTLQGGTQMRQSISLQPSASGAATTVDAARAIAATVAGTPALVEIPASALVDAASGAAASGLVTVNVTPIAPASRTSAMPGSYLFATPNGNAPLESFGAIHVQLQDAAGKRLQLASGKTAKIRIPVSTRALELPATIPLFYLDESTGIWKQEGTAKLDTVTRAFYEGTVSHFSYWNADQALDTVNVTGCVRDEQGRVPAYGTVRTEGMDYSGSALAVTDERGAFSVGMKRNGRATVTAAMGDKESSPATAKAGDADVKLAECLVVKAPPQGIHIIEQPPAEMPVVEGGSALLVVVATATEPLRYQWLRNGELLAGQTSPRLFISAVGALDDGAVYRLRISGPTGETLTNGTKLTMASQQAMLNQLISVLPMGASLAMAPAETVDMDTAVMLRPAQVCSKGSVQGVRLDNVAVTGGEALSANTQHTLAVEFIGCDTSGADFTGNLFTGKASASFNYTLSADGATLTLQSTTTLVNLLAFDADDGSLVGNGVFDVRESASEVAPNSISVTPRAGASMRRADTDHLITYISGNMTLSVTTGADGLAHDLTYTYQKLTFTLAGKTYVLDGTATSIEKGGSTQPDRYISVKVNNVEVARWRGINNASITQPIDAF